MSDYDKTDTGVLFKNDRRETDKHPTHTGSLNVSGQDYWLSAWVKESKAGKKFFSLAIKPKDTKASAPVREVLREAQDDFQDSGIPF